MAKPKKKTKKGKKPPLSKLRDQESWKFHPNHFRVREVDPKLLKRVTDLDWTPKRCFIAFDWDEGRMCLIFPELGLEGEMWRYTEFNLVGEATGHLLWGSEIEEILKKAKKAGKRRRLL